MHIMRYNDWHRIPPQNPDVLEKKRRAKRLSASEELIIPQVIFFNLFVCVCVCVRVYTHTPTHPHFFFAESIPLATGLTKVEFSKLWGPSVLIRVRSYRSLSPRPASPAAGEREKENTAAVSVVELVLWSEGGCKRCQRVRVYRITCSSIIQ